MTKKQYPLLLVGLGLLFYFPFLGHVHLFDWDEINFAESAREMLVTGNYTRVQIDFQPFWEKPPLFFWLQVASMRVFGIGEFAARFPNAVMGVVTLLTLFYLGRKLVDARFGLIWALGYLGSVAPHFYFKTGIIDPTFNYFIFVGIWFLFRRNFLLSGLLVGLAVLTKGPVGALLTGLTFVSFWAINRFRPLLTWRDALAWVGCVAGVTSLWFGPEILQNGPWFLQEFITYQIRLFSTPDAGHEQPFYYHFVVVLIGCFPMSILAIRYLVRLNSRTVEQSDSGTVGQWDSRTVGQSDSQTVRQFNRLMVCLFWVVLILFSVVRTKIVHYSSLAWFPVSYLAAYHLYLLLAGKVKWNRWITVGLLGVGGLLGLALTALPLVGMNAKAISPLIEDPFVVGNLQAPVQWAGWEWGIGAAWLVALVGCVLAVRRVGFWAIIGLYGATAGMLWAYSAVMVPKIEQYVQGAVIAFYESKRGQDVIVEPIGYKSYAHLFYFQKQPPADPRLHDEDFLLNGKLTKPTFLVTKTDRADEYRKHPNLVLVKEENGFVFFRRK
jgi:4-amino-4-deoxy-L-arabinose transferase-like glycosyltransferase